MQQRNIAMMDAQNTVDTCTSRSAGRDPGSYEYIGYSQSGRRIKVILNENPTNAALLITTYPVQGDDRSARVED